MTPKPLAVLTAITTVFASVVVSVAPVAAAPGAEIRSIRFPVLGGASFVDTFGAPRSGGRTHQGQDLFAPKMRVLVATTDATVVRMSAASSGISGNYVVIEDEAGWEYLYIHVNNDTPGTDDGANRRLEAFLPGIYPGAKVYAGQPLGYLGDSGNAEGTPPHVHFEIRDPWGTPINPIESLRSASHAPIDPATYAAGMSAGSWDATLLAPGGVFTSGWAHDPDGAPGAVEVYVDGRLGGVHPTSERRDDVAAARGAGATYAGFSGTVAAGAGTHSVCLWARNVGRGPASYLGCRGVGIEALPLGNLDTAAADSISGTAVASGWALDLQTDAASEIHVYVNGEFAGWGYGGIARPDVQSIFPLHAPQHGFAIRVPVPRGTSSLCAYAIDDARADRARLLGCRSVTRTTTPFGSVDAVQRVPGGARMVGWAIDADTADSIDVHVYSAGRLVGYGRAGLPRPDVAAAYPTYGAAHGFSVTLGLGPGTHVVCGYAIDAQGGPNPMVGCRSVEVSPAPVGNVDAMSRQGDTAVVHGWTLDPDVASSIDVHVYVDGRFAGWGRASADRTDVEAAYPGYGAAHGFSVSVPLAPGGHQVCAYAINAGTGALNPLLGCRTV